MVFVYIFHILIVWGAMDCIVATWDGDAGRAIDEGATSVAGGKAETKQATSSTDKTCHL